MSIHAHLVVRNGTFVSVRSKMKPPMLMYLRLRIAVVCTVRRQTRLIVYQLLVLSGMIRLVRSARRHQSMRLMSRFICCSSRILVRPASN